jgi:hypothetical protein
MKGNNPLRVQCEAAAPRVKGPPRVNLQTRVRAI